VENAMSEPAESVDMVTDETIKEKLVDAMIPGFQAEFDPEEAERAGAFIEDALNETDALESNIDLDFSETLDPGL
jgi:hypothetical protein